MINKHKTAYAMIVLLQNYKYNCPCFCIANKQIDTAFHGEAGRMIAHDNTCDSHAWEKRISLQFNNQNIKTYEYSSFECHFFQKKKNHF